MVQQMVKDSPARQRAMKKFKETHPDYWHKKNTEFYAANREQEKLRRKENYAKNTEIEKDRQRTYYAKNREEILQKQKRNIKRKEYFKQYYRELKERVVSAYGGCCECCGDCHFEFMTIDHINGGGRKDRAQKAGAGFYASLEKRGFPKEGYRLLCMNCNFALGKYGHCPHKT
jgi:hypothetical protein